MDACLRIDPQFRALQPFKRGVLHCNCLFQIRNNMHLCLQGNQQELQWEDAAILLLCGAVPLCEAEAPPGYNFLLNLLHVCLPVPILFKASTLYAVT